MERKTSSAKIVNSSVEGRVFVEEGPTIEISVFGSNVWGREL